MRVECIDKEFDLTVGKTNLDISKPAKYRIGEYTSVAIVHDVFRKTEDGRLDLENMMDKINKAMLLIDNVTARL